MNDVFILHCSVSASVRQSVQIAFEDYKLPADVIETLRKADAISIRPRISGALKKYLDELRLMQRYLYDRCTINQGDVHFLHPDDFDEAMSRINEIKARAHEFNEQLKDLWSSELTKWEATIDNFFSPLFKDRQQLSMVREAYMKIFPTAKEFAAPISVSVVGPYPAKLERSDTPDCLEDRIQNEAAINTEEVLKAAQAGALDASMGKIAELLDDLDARPAHKVGERVLSTNNKKRGAWRIIQSDLQLSAKHNPTLQTMSALVQELIQVGETMRDAPKGVARMAAFKRYASVREEIQEEARAIIKGKDSSKGLESLQMSLTLSNTYQDLISNLTNCETLDDLKTYQTELETQTSVYKHRAKHLSQIFSKCQERLVANSHLEAIASELEEADIKSTQDCDF
tara:strand:- start:12300 stop:13499 length:1200 start_codon:yes stop_codon:yes gene_type:complete